MAIAHSEVQVSKDRVRKVGTTNIVGYFDQVCSKIVTQYSVSTVQLTPSFHVEEVAVENELLAKARNMWASDLLYAESIESESRLIFSIGQAGQHDIAVLRCHCVVDDSALEFNWKLRPTYGGVIRGLYSFRDVSRNEI